MTTDTPALDAKTARALDSLRALLHATRDRAWPHVESMALERVEKELRRLYAMERRALETWVAIGPPSEYAHGVRDALAMILLDDLPAGED